MIRTYVSITCDVCRTAGLTAPTQRECRERARVNGWRIGHTVGAHDLCAACHRTYVKLQGRVAGRG